MTPLFKTHYSFGKSILTLENKGEERSLFTIAEEHDLKRLVVVEDTLCGYRELEKICIEKNLDFVFGWRVDCIEEAEEDLNNSHKLIIFSIDNEQGRLDLFRLHNNVRQVKGQQALTINYLKEYWTDNLHLAIPFYDSFIFQNTVYGKSCVVDFSWTKPIMFLENNNLPFDLDIRNLVRKYAKSENLETEEVKSIYYKNKQDFTAWQVYKLITGRAFWGNANINVPSMDYCCSNELCFQSYLENINNHENNEENCSTRAS